MTTFKPSDFSSPRPSILLIAFFFVYACVWTLGLGFYTNFLGDAVSPILHIHCADQHIFTLFAKGILEGKAIYADLWDHKGPLLFLLYVPFVWMSGENVNIALLIMQVLCSFTVLFFSWKLARLFLGARLSLLIVLLLPVVLGTYSANATDIFVPLQVISLYLFIRKHKTGSEQSILFPLGVCTSLVFFSKYTLCAFWIPLFFVELYWLWRHRPASALLRELGKCVLFFVALAALVFQFASPLQTWQTYVEFNLLYGSNAPSILMSNPKEVFERLLWPHPIGLQLLFYLALPTTLAGLVLLLGFLFSWPEYRKSLPCLIPCALSMVLTLIMAASTPVMRDYYYLTLHPFFILSLIFILYRLHRVLSHRAMFARWSLALYRMAIAFILVVLAGLAARYQLEARSGAQRVNEMHRYISDHISPEDTLLTVGFDVALFDAYVQVDTLPLRHYFFEPFIPRSMFPYFHDATLEIITNGEAQHVLLRNNETTAPYIECLKASGRYQSRTAKGASGQVLFEHYTRQ